MEALNRRYEAENYRDAESNHRIATVTTDLLLVFYLPAWLFPLGRPVAHAFMDAPLRAAIGFPAAPRWLSGVVHGAMQLRARALRMLPARKEPHLLTRVRRPTYPPGYRIEDLGTLARQGVGEVRG